MLTSKPKFQSLFSITVFVISCLVIGAVMLINYNEEFWQQVLIAFLLPLGLILGVRTLWQYKIIRFGQNRIELSYPVRFKKMTIPIKSLDSWTEEKVKTMGSLFQEITLKTGGKKARFSNQEFTNYQKAKSYLEKKAGKKKI